MKSGLMGWLADLAETARGVRQLARHRQAGSADDQEALLEASQTLVEQLHPKWMRLRLIERIRETPTTCTLRFERIDGSLPPFRPGQYISLKLRIGDVSTTRPYSLSSAPGTGHFDVTLRLKESGLASPFLFGEFEPGWEVEATGPAGSFVYEPLCDRGDLVFLAGGSGITPFMSMLRHFSRMGFPAPVTLLYGSRLENDVIFATELDRLQREHRELEVVSIISEPQTHCSGPSGFINAELIARHVGAVEGKTFFVCGPEQMLAAITVALQSLKVPSHKVRRESFGPPLDVTREPRWPAGVAADQEYSVEVVGRGHLTARAGEPLLSALERSGVAVPSSCRTGECAECRMRLIEGHVYELPGAGVRESDRAVGVVHTCVSYATSNLRLESDR